MQHSEVIPRINAISALQVKRKVRLNTVKQVQHSEVIPRINAISALQVNVKFG